MTRVLVRASVLAAGLLAAIGVLGAPAAEAARKVPFQRGMTLAEWGPTAYEPSAVRARLRTLRRRYAVDSVTLIVVWNQDDGRSTTVQPGPQTVPDENLVAAIRSARRLGMKVVLRPYLDPRGVWRGLIEPASVDAWFESYGQFILQYASLARRERARGFVIGSEMKSLSRYAARWKSLARAVRRRFRGFVTYQANHDEPVTWWRSVDAISISAYYSLTREEQYSVPDLVRAWGPYFNLVNGMRSRMRRPVMFGEIGYRSIEGSAMEPWDTGRQGNSSPEAQRVAYEAALRVWFRRPWFRGFHWWYVPAQDALVDGQPGADHRPLQPALSTVGRWYRKRR